MAQNENFQITYRSGWYGYKLRAAGDETNYGPFTTRELALAAAKQAFKEYQRKLLKQRAYQPKENS